MDSEKLKNKAKFYEKWELTIRPLSHFLVLHGIRTSMFKFVSTLSRILTPLFRFSLFMVMV